MCSLSEYSTAISSVVISEMLNLLIIVVGLVSINETLPSATIFPLITVLIISKSASEHRY
jgi:hypothetical protein